MEQNRFGRLSVRCHYEAAEQRLAVEVLHAADLLPLDANGEVQRGWVGLGRRLADGGELQRGWAAGLLTAVPYRPERPLRGCGTGPTSPLPTGPQPEDPGQGPDAAPSV